MNVFNYFLLGFLSNSILMRVTGDVPSTDIMYPVALWLVVATIVLVKHIRKYHGD